MKLEELLGLLNGQYIEVAGTDAKNQCVDAANAYIKYVLGLPPIEHANAKDFPSRAGDQFEFIINAPANTPKEGDLVIWDGQYGHIAIFIEGDTKRFTSFDQNYPTGSPCHIQEHTYKGVVGWLHPKNAPQSDQSLIDQLRADRDKNWNLYQQEQQAKILLEDAVGSKQKTIDSITKENLQLKETVNSVTSDKINLSTSVSELKTTLGDTKNELDVCNGLLANRKDLAKYTAGELISELLSRIHLRR